MAAPAPVRMYHPLTVGEILDETIRVFRGNLVSMAGLGAALQLPVVVIQLVLVGLLPSFSRGMIGAAAGGGDPTRLLGQVLTFYATMAGVAVPLLLVYAALYPLFAGAVVLATSRAFLGERLGFRAAVRGAVKYWLPLFVNGLVYGVLQGILWVFFLVVYFILVFGVAMGVGMAGGGESPAAIAAFVGMFVLLILAILAGFLAFESYMYVFRPATVNEGGQIVTPLGRSFQLVRGRFWRTLGLALLVWLALLVAQMIFTVPLTIWNLFAPGALAGTVTVVVSGVVQAVLVPLRLMVPVLAYFDLRMRKEGLDIELMAQQLGPAPPPGSPGAPAGPPPAARPGAPEGPPPAEPRGEEPRP